MLIVYGQAYAASAEVLRLHFAATPFVFVGTVGLFHLTVLRQERLALCCAGAGLGLNIVLDLVLIPRTGTGRCGCGDPRRRSGDRDWSGVDSLDHSRPNSRHRRRDIGCQTLVLRQSVRRRARATSVSVGLA